MRLKTELGNNLVSISLNGGEPGQPGKDGEQGEDGRGGKGGYWPGGMPADWKILGIIGSGEDHSARGRPSRKRPINNRMSRPPTTGADFGTKKILFNPITVFDFVDKWNAPRIATLEPVKVTVGQRVTLRGENFSVTDKIFLTSKGVGNVDQVVALARVDFKSDKLLSFVVPDMIGGMVAIELKPADGPSFVINMMLNSQIESVFPAGRLTPGTRAIIKGSGFSPKSRVILAGSNSETSPEFIDKNTLSFLVHRSAGPVRNTERNGEVRPLQITHEVADTSSNVLQVILDTFRIVVLGDSVLWGQGLLEGQGTPTKIHEHVVDGLAKRLPKHIGIHVTNLAHSGAIIGFDEGANGLGAPLDGDRTARAPDGVPAAGVGLDQEVNASFPTIFQQANSFDGPSDTVDLVLLGGGMNDVNARKLLPSLDDAVLTRRIRMHCRDGMERLLIRVAEKFPAANIVLLGYFPIISLATDLDKFPEYLAAKAVNVTLGHVFAAEAVAAIAAAAATVAASTTSLNPAVVAAATMTASLAAVEAENRMVLAQLAHNCRLFYEESEMAFQEAIDHVNALQAGTSRAAPRRIFLAAPEFDETDAVFAPNAKLYGLRADTRAEGDESVRDERIIACDTFYQGDEAGRQVCHRASAGHPNQSGAKVYAKEILATLDMNGVFGTAKFSAPLLWGAATAAHQVEGNIENNDWHHFTNSQRIRKRVNGLGEQVGLDINLQPAATAVGHHEIEIVIKELDRMKALGMNAYRFSIEWSRVEPREGAIDEVALEHYDAVIDAILARQMTPVVTLNHLTLPEWILRPPQESMPIFASDQDPDYLASKQGWLTHATVDAFVGYATLLARRYVDRVKYWITLNEPVASMIGVGYIGGLWSPGFTLDGSKAKQVYFNLLRAHVKAYDAIKTVYRRNGDVDQCAIGIAHAMMFAKLPLPETGVNAIDNYSFADLAKTRDQFNYYFNWHFIDSLMTEDINEELDLSHHERTPSAEFYGVPFRHRLDFLGINYYRSIYLQNGLPEMVMQGAMQVAGAGFLGGTFSQNLKKDKKPHHLLNDLTWEIYPKGIYAIIKAAQARYPDDARGVPILPPILISENGIPEVEDKNRAAYTISHIQQLLRASQEGVKVLGYLHWSIVDNFEWFENYNPKARFGLFSVNRTPSTGDGKDFDRHMTEGALALQYLIAENGIGRAVERFGVVHPKGYTVSPPLLSSGLAWNGIFNATQLSSPFTIYITRRADGSDIGMIFIKTSKMWYRLQTVKKQEDAFVFSFLFEGITIECSAVVERPGMLLNGLQTIKSPARVLARDVRWSAQRAPLFGNWEVAGTNRARHSLLQFSRMEGDFAPWLAKTWHGEKESAWVTCKTVKVADDVRTFSFELDANAITGQLDDSMNLMVITTVKTGQSVTANRLSSGIS